MKPFLLLATRAEDAAADSEYDALLRGMGLDESQLVRHRLERDPLGEIDLADWTGIVIGGSPFNNSDPAESKSATQVRVEAELQGLARRVIAEDFPLLGACYGIGTLGVLDGGVVDRQFGEPVSCVEVTLTEAGRLDPLFGLLPERFDAFVGHKEAVSALPRGAVLLASSENCPVQAFRIGANVYATQFHPELDADGIATRVDAYEGHGYFAPGEGDAVKEMARQHQPEAVVEILAGFVEIASAARRAN